ncbi:hypothetical protein DYI25_18950 [Mesobacillus boroniphilus]|uniref:Uncharacterized protein n=1 Tax=Mesobacillus boroniphilus TaxID=308892 RepID=A0A944CNT0_9BACI|nr:hypothetical protein [Mesobacillus boroniphilus]MBS8266504.1 hypothetical protein [Mesobacillus boroniphilus]
MGIRNDEAAAPEIRQELSSVSDALESGSITLDHALFWDHIEARKILRTDFSDVGFHHITLGS